MRAAIAALLLSTPAALQTVGAPAPAAAAVSSTARDASSTARTLSVALDRKVIFTQIGERFSFSSTVRNDSDQPMRGAIAHLNVLSLDPEVYVDPEDWSSRRTIYLDALSARHSVRLNWTVQAVNPGRFLIYTALTTPQGGDGVIASNTLRLSVAQQRTINPGGVLPLAVAMPAGVLLLWALAAHRRRRLR